MFTVPTGAVLLVIAIVAYAIVRVIGHLAARADERRAADLAARRAAEWEQRAGESARRGLLDY